MEANNYKQKLKQAGKQIAGCLIESLLHGLLSAISTVSKEVGGSLIKAGDSIGKGDCRDRTTMTSGYVNFGNEDNCIETVTTATNVTTKHKKI